VPAVIAAVEDLFFAVRIQETARQLGVSLALAPGGEETRRQVASQRPALLILDLDAAGGRPLDTIRALKGDPATAETRILGFLSHVQQDLRRAALAAGCDEVLPRSAFTARLPEILSRALPPEVGK
jgi:CheY-like chemotaxis protein